VLAAIVCISLIGRTRRVQRRWLLALISVFLCSSGGMLAILNPSVDLLSWEFTEQYFVISHLILAVIAGYGLVLLGLRFSGERSS